LQIDDDAFLAAIAANEIMALAIAERRKRARVVAGAGRLDLQNFSAKISQRERRRRTRKYARKIQNAHAGERTRPSFFRCHHARLIWFIRRDAYGSARRWRCKPRAIPAGPANIGSNGPSLRRRSAWTRRRP